MSEGTPAVVLAGENNAAEGADLARGAAGNVGVAGTAPADPATAPAPAPAGVAALSTNGDAPTTAAAAPVAVSSGTPENGHRPGAAAENGQATEVAPASEPASTASRKRKAGEEVPKTPAAEPAATTPAPGKTTLLAGVRVEDLAPPVRARMEDVLREGEDDGMRKDVRLINFLGEVEEAQALAALNEYHAAVSETSVTIRNKPAYLMGILRKYKQGQRAPLGNGVGGGMATAPNAMGRMGAGPDGLSPSIAKRLQKLYDSGFIEKADVDQRCMVFFRDLTEPEAEAAMDEFGQSDITSIRNKSAFLMSILRRHHQANNTPPGTAAAAAGGASATPAAGGGGARPPPTAAASAAAAAAAAAGMGMGMGGMGMGMYGGHPFVGAPHMPHPYGFMDPSMGVPAPFADFYGGVYGHGPPPLFNAYGQPMATFIPPHMPMYQPGCSEMLPASIQLRLDQLATTGFCHPGEIDDRCRKFLREVPEHIALQAIDEFMSTDRKSIRKVSAYFMGVIRKHAETYREFVAAASSPAPAAGPPHPYEAGMKRIREYSDFWAKNSPKAQGGSALMERMAGAPAKVQAGINDLIEKGIAVEWDIDVRVTNAFLALTEEQGVEALEEFASCDMSRIRNKSAYLMGLLKRYKSGAPPPPGLAQR